MAIPDMASAFQFSGTARANATVHCDGPQQNSNAYSSLSDGEDPKAYYHPKFHLNSDRIWLPNINQTASHVYNRIIPNPRGDCKLIDSARNPTSFKLYNITVTGLPVSIGCNITAATNIDGVAVPLGAPAQLSTLTSGSDSQLRIANTTNTPALSYPANASTDGVSGAYIAPPPATPFKIPFNYTNSICFSGPSSASPCFPNGAYVLQTGIFGYSTKNITSMTIAEGTSLQITVTAGQSVRGGVHAVTDAFNSSENITRSPVCLFDEKNFGGQFFCLGVGGGSLTSAHQHTAQSIREFGGTTAYLFAETGYADASETAVTVDVPDLSSEPYGTNNNFAAKVKALWIRAGT